mgnify:FL=1
MESGPFSNAQVKAESKKFVMVKVDGDKDQAHVQAAGVKGYPTFQILDPDGKEIWKDAGYMEVDALLRVFADALAKVPPPEK